MKKFLIALAASTALIGAAQAGDLNHRGGLKDAPSADRLPEPRVEEHRDYSWTRVWLGVIGGYGMANSAVDLSSFKQETGEEAERLGRIGFDGVGGEGIFGEIQGGVDYQLGRFVVGAYGFTSLSDAQSELSISEGSDGEKATLQQEESYGVGARGGYLISPATMVYVGAGWRWTGFDLSLPDGGNITIGKDDGEKVVDLTERDGAFVETGLEGRLSQTVGWKVFGRYTFYDDLNYEGVNFQNEDCKVWDELGIDTGELQFGAGLTVSLGVPEARF